MNNLYNLKARLKNDGGIQQQDRMIKHKYKTLKRVFVNSYQGAQVQLLHSDKICSALMNPNKLLADYDEKTISVEYNQGFKTGEIFRWINPSRENGETYWLIYLQDLTELAYFRANVRRCGYEITWRDENNNLQSSYVALRGPKEQQIESIGKSQFSIDVPNYSIQILMPKNENTIKFFKRYAKFYLQNLSENDTPICWRVEAVDTLTLPGILTVHAKEYYSNRDEDDVVTGEVGGLLTPAVSPEQATEENKVIVGDNFIKPYYTAIYQYNGSDLPSWQWDPELPVKIDIDGIVATVTWEASYSGEFQLSCNGHVKTIIVESLF